MIGIVHYYMDIDELSCLFSWLHCTGCVVLDMSPLPLQEKLLQLMRQMRQEEEMGSQWVPVVKVVTVSLEACLRRSHEEFFFHKKHNPNGSIM